MIEIESDGEKYTFRSYNSTDIYNTLLLIQSYIPPFDYSVGQLYASLSHYVHDITNFVPS